MINGQAWVALLSIRFDGSKPDNLERHPRERCGSCEV
jgi:hypothetical protein